MVGRVNGFFDSGGRFSWVLIIWLAFRFLDRVWLFGGFGFFSFFLIDEIHHWSGL